METRQTILLLHPHLCASYMPKYMPLYTIAVECPWREPVGVMSFVCIAWGQALIWCCSLLGSHHVSALRADRLLFGVAGPQSRTSSL